MSQHYNNNLPEEPCRIMPRSGYFLPYEDEPEVRHSLDDEPDDFSRPQQSEDESPDQLRKEFGGV